MGDEAHLPAPRLGCAGTVKRPRWARASPRPPCSPWATPAGPWLYAAHFPRLVSSPVVLPSPGLN